MTAFKMTLATVAALVVTAAASAQTIRLGVAGQGSSNGFRISDVLPNTPASDIGLEAGDRIVSINNTVIRSGDVLRQTLTTANAMGGHIVMLVQDVRGTGFLVIECDLLEETSGPVYSIAAPGSVGAAPAPAMKKLVVKNIKKTRK